MARTSSTPAKTAGSPKRLAIDLLESVRSLWALCAKHRRRVSRKLRVESTRSRVAPRSHLARPKQLLGTIQFRHRKRAAEDDEEELFQLEADAEFGDGGLWQRTILMGDKCQPLDFPGVIYYDSNGKQLHELPMRSPRASPLASYFFSAAKQE